MKTLFWNLEIKWLSPTSMGFEWDHKEVGSFSQTFEDKPSENQLSRVIAGF